MIDMGMQNELKRVYAPVNCSPQCYVNGHAACMTFEDTYSEQFVTGNPQSHMYFHIKFCKSIIKVRKFSDAISSNLILW